MGGFPEEELLNVPQEDPLVLTGQAGDEIRGKGGGEELPDQIEPLRQEGPLPYPVYQPPGLPVEALDPQADPGDPPLPAGGEEGGICGFGVSLQAEFLRPFGEEGTESPQEPPDAGGSQDGGGAAADVEAGNPADLKATEQGPGIPEEEFDKPGKPGILGDRGKGVEIAVVTGPGAEGNMEVEGGPVDGERPAGKVQGRPSRVTGQ
jgi:hypothetical protein